MRGIKRKENLIFATLLLLLATVLAVLNHEAGTWLTGWDNHHPEFNPLLSITRDLATVWRENRGLGLVDGISHASDLPREAFVLFLSAFMAPENIRYFVTLLMLPVGSIGMFYFVKRRLLPSKSAFFAFLGGAFYLLSPAMVQNFYTPLSTFTVLYGFLPWLFLLIFAYLKSGIRKDLRKFALVSLLAAPFGYTATLYAVYLGFLFLLGVFYTLNRSRERKRAILLVVVSLLMNLYWILPFSYFAFTKAGVVGEAVTNQLSSEEVYFRNRAYGGLADFPLLKGYQLSAREPNIGTGTHELIYLPWVEHMGSSSFGIAGYALFGFVLFGFLVSLKKGSQVGKAISLMFLASGIFLLSGLPGLAEILEFARNNIPLAGEALRFAYTKFSIFALFSFAALFAVGFSQFSGVLKRNFSSYGVFLSWGFGFVAILSMGFLVKPAFSGNLIYDRLRVEIPQEYFDLFDYMEGIDSEGRILYLPAYEHWPWRRHSWGYTGSGFFRYGLENPLVDRAFDVWSPYNESLFQELRVAQINGDVSVAMALLDKYNVEYVVFDSTVVNTGISSEYRNRAEEVYSGILDSQDIQLEKNFSSALALYRYEAIPELVTGRDLGPVFGSSLRRSLSTEGTGVVLEEIVPADGFITAPEGGFLEGSITVDVSVVSSGEGQVFTVTPILPPLLSETATLESNPSPHTVSLNLGEEYLLTVGVQTIGPVSPGFSGELGTVAISPSQPRKFVVSNATPLRQTQVFRNYFEAELFSCGELSSGSFEIKRGESGLVIEANNNLACVNTGPLNVGVSDVSSVEIVLNSSENTNLRYCLLHEGDCLNTKQNLSPDLSGNYKDYFFTDSLKLASSFEVYVGPIEDPLPALLDVSDITLSQYESLYEAALAFDTSNDVESIAVARGERVTTTLEGVPLDLDFSASRCSVNLPEKYTSNLVDYSFEGEAHTFVSLNATGCYKALLPETESDALVISTEVRHVSGMRPQICIRDLSTDECIVRERLDEGRNHTVVPSGNWNSGLGLEILNPSFANVTSGNLITSFSYSSLPLSYIKGIHLVLPETSKLVTNNQSFDPGWVALCGARICPAEHVLVNTWANGWVFENADIPASVNLVFWPQILQFIGYFGLLATLFFLATKAKNNPTDFTP